VIARIFPNPVANMVADDLVPPVMVGHTAIHITIAGLILAGVFLRALLTKALPALSEGHREGAGGWAALLYGLTALLGAWTWWLVVDPYGFWVPLGNAMASQGLP
jgi:hypothetical protein